jgi:hypothetical protein
MVARNVDINHLANIPIHIQIKEIVHKNSYEQTKKTALKVALKVALNKE